MPAIKESAINFHDNNFVLYLMATGFLRGVSRMEDWGVSMVTSCWVVGVGWNAAMWGVGVVSVRGVSKR